MPTTKKKILVVKSLRDLSPKKQAFVSRRPFGDEEIEDLESSQIGNSSPTKPIKGKDGNYLQRSILGDAATFDMLDRKRRQDSGADANRGRSSSGGESTRAKSSERKTERLGSGSNNNSNAAKFSSRARLHVGSPLLEESSQDIDVDEGEPVAFVNNPVQYLESLKKQQENALKIQRRDVDEENTLINFLPAHERFNLNKEGKVLTRWQERVRAWERIESNISKRIKSDKGHLLLMETIDDYRPQKEEYEMLQVAKPVEDSYGPNGWKTSLRGGSGRLVSVGHVFSGLECEVDKPPRPPPMIRKPRPVGQYPLGTSFLEETATLIAKRKTVAKELATLRPHVVSFEDAESLVVRSTDLFDWAIKSSKEYFEERQASVDEVNDRMAMLSVNGRDLPAPPTSSKSDTPIAISGSSGLQLQSPTDLVFEAVRGRPVYRNFSFTNTGTVAIKFNWRRVVEKENNTQGSMPKLQSIEQSRFKNILHGKDLQLMPREFAIKTQRPLFSCVESEGTILPGDTIHCRFAFGQVPITGSFVERWLLDTVPRTSATQLRIDDGGNQGGMALLSTPLVVVLHAHSVDVDESMTSRRDLQDSINTSVLSSLARDEIEKCIQRVRNPVRIRTIRERQFQLFKEINAPLLQALHGDLAVPLPLYLDETRLNAFNDICERATAFAANVQKRLYSLRIKRELADQELSAVDFWDDAVVLEQPGLADELSTIATAHKVPTALEAIKLRLFPEAFIEIFDEITEGDIAAPWDMDVGKILRAVDLAVKSSWEIKELEATLLKRIDVYVKSEAKRIRKAERRAALEQAWEDAPTDDEDDGPPEDDEEEEEEEEEEEDPEVAEQRAKQKHALTVSAEALRDECLAAINVLVTQGLDKSVLERAVAATIGDALDQLESLRAEAVAAAGLAVDAKIPQLPPLSDEVASQAAWTAATNAVSAAAAAAAAPVKGGKGKAAAEPAGGSAEQFNKFYGTLFNSVRGALLNAMDTAFADIDQTMARNADGEAQFLHTTLNVATVRPSDISANFKDTNNGKVVFVAFPGEALSTSYFETGMDLKSSELRRTVRILKQYGEAGAKAIVCLYEAPAQSADKEESLLIYTGQIQELINGLVKDEGNLLNKAIRRQEKPLKETAKYEHQDVIVNLAFDVHACNSIGELKYHLKRVAETPKVETAVEDARDAIIAALAADPNRKKRQKKRQRKPVVTLNNKIPIFILENSRKRGVIPPEPALPDYQSDDEDAPVTIGEVEFFANREREWNNLRPHKVTVPIVIDKQTHNVQCYADTWASFVDVYSLLEQSPYGALWVDSSLNSLFQLKENCSWQNTSPRLNKKRFASPAVREASIWAGLLLSLPKSKDILAEDAAASEGDSSIGDVIDPRIAGVPQGQIGTLANYLSYLFPHRKTTPEGGGGIRSTAVIGGALRGNKFAVLDRLVDLVDTIYLAGELALPFLAFEAVQLSKYVDICSKFRSATKVIVSKARARGVKLILPSDLSVADEPLKEITKKTSSGGSLDEGVDYDGDIKVLPLSLERSDSVVTIDGYVFDIGPSSCKDLKTLIETSDLVINYGTLGACETSSFQVGQRALVEALARKPYDEEAPGASTSSSSKPQALVIGNTTVEWFARIVDPDGERAGAISEAGIVAYTCRFSGLFVGILRNSYSAILDAFSTRPPVGGEWIYNGKPLPEVEDDEE